MIENLTLRMYPGGGAPGDRHRTPTGLSRRLFIFGGAALVSGAAFVGLRRTTVKPALPMPGGRGRRVITVTRFAADGEPVGQTTGPRIVHTDEEWRRRLGPDAYRVMRLAETGAAPSADRLLHEIGAACFVARLRAGCV